MVGLSGRSLAVHAVTKQFIACSLGVDSSSVEHQVIPATFVMGMNHHVDYTALRSYYTDAVLSNLTVKERKEVKKKLKQARKSDILMGRWDNTPYRRFVLNPSLPCTVAYVHINNDSLRGTYNPILSNGGYGYIEIGFQQFAGFAERTESSVSEAVLFGTQGYAFNDGLDGTVGTVPVLCDWSGTQPATTIRLLVGGEKLNTKAVADGIMASLRSGNLAFVDRMQGIRGYGGILVDLDMCYHAMKSDIRWIE